MHALIVDDQPSTLMLMRRILDRAGYQVVECSRGAGAIAALRTTDFDLVVIDINLPDLSGFDVLLSPELSPKLLPPVLGITSALTPEIQSRALAAGMCRVLEKPVSYDQLTEAAALAIKLGNRSSSAGGGRAPLPPILDTVTLADVRSLHRDQALARRFVEQAIVDARACLTQLQATERSKDTLAWCVHARSLDGIALTIGARRLTSSISAALEMPQSELHDALGRLTRDFDVLLTEAEHAIRSWFEPQLLTQRETTVLRWTAAGKTSGEIGIILGISTRTVNFHITTALTKLDAVNKTQAVVKAVTLGMLVVDGITGLDD